MRYNHIFYTYIGNNVILIERILINQERNTISFSSYFLGNHQIKLYKLVKKVKSGKCGKCGTKLILGTNWTQRQKRMRWYICKKCEQEKLKEYYRKHIIITTNENGEKIRIKTNKRPRLENCELCGWVRNILVYHHWDDKNPHFGMWLCGVCHKVVEIFECKTNIIEEYIQLKKQIEEEIG
jgi:hypothetical protein